MAQPYVGEVRMFAGDFAPQGWFLCNGQLLPISEYETLFLLIGTTYGGDGQATFALPDLRGRAPTHVGSGLALAQTGGVESITLATAQIPAHTHAVAASTATGNRASPSGAVWAASGANQYSAVAPSNAMDAANVLSTGGGQPHENMVPFVTLNFIISLYGIFPAP